MVLVSCVFTLLVSCYVYEVNVNGMEIYDCNKMDTRLTVP